MGIILGVIALLVLITILSTVFIVQQQTVIIIERFGKFHKQVDAGIHIRAPFGIDKIATKIPLRVQQDTLEIETKTKDNVFVTMNVSTQFVVSENNVSDAFYKLQSPVLQIRSYIEDALRAAVPTLTLDELFEKKDEIALHVQTQVAEEMGSYGYKIIKTLITSVEPDSEVKASMNEINAAQRKRAAAQELAEADRIKTVTAAKAEAEKDQLHGEGIAKERKAIVDGLTESFAELKQSGLTESEVMSILLTNQYLDTLDSFAKYGATSIFLPASPNGAEEIRTQVLSALQVGKQNKQDVK